MARPGPVGPGPRSIGAPDSIEWGGVPFLAYGSPVQVSGTEAPGALRIVRVGFTHASAIFAAPDEVFDLSAMYWLHGNSCMVQEYRRIECTRAGRAAISVRAVDRVSGRPVPHGYTATAREGSYVSTKSVTGPREWQTTGWKEVGLELAHDRVGTYDVEVTAPGYRMWSVGNIRVLPGRCHVQMVVLIAYLEPG